MQASTKRYQQICCRKSSTESKAKQLNRLVKQLLGNIPKIQCRMSQTKTFSFTKIDLKSPTLVLPNIRQKATKIWRVNSYKFRLTIILVVVYITIVPTNISLHVLVFSLAALISPSHLLRTWKVLSIVETSTSQRITNLMLPDTWTINS